MKKSGYFLSIPTKTENKFSALFTIKTGTKVANTKLNGNAHHFCAFFEIAIIAVNDPMAMKYAKVCIDRGMQRDIDDGIAPENEQFAICFAAADRRGAWATSLKNAPKRISRTDKEKQHL